MLGFIYLLLKLERRRGIFHTLLICYGDSNLKPLIYKSILFSAKLKSVGIFIISIASSSLGIGRLVYVNISGIYRTYIHMTLILKVAL